MFLRYRTQLTSYQGLDPSSLLNNSLWWNGPTFLATKDFPKRNILSSVTDSDEFNCEFKMLDLTTQAFIASLKRFIARRGRPSLIFSDNGKTFIRANAELKRLYKLVINPDPELAGFLVDENINWKLLPPPEHQILAAYGKLA
ncbi:integrase catalytic domain-containing protein [Trichonephila clavipes]|nr:integrase catalytic domain-containing protein [Trichonephila clavipes]